MVAILCRMPNVQKRPPIGQPFPVGVRLFGDLGGQWNEEQGRNVLDRLAEDLKDVATVESKPQMEGRNMHMLIVPIKGAFDEKASDDDKSQKEN